MNSFAGVFNPVVVYKTIPMEGGRDDYVDDDGDGGDDDDDAEKDR